MIVMNDIQKLSDIFKALSDPTRLKIIRMLSQNQRPACVNALTNRLDISQSAVSQHLKILKQAGLVQAERRGNFIHYTLENTAVESFRERLAEKQVDDLLILDANGAVHFGPHFWNKANKLETLERHLAHLQEKTAEIESIIGELKK